MSLAPQVWVTRAELGASATAARVAALGFRPLIGPLLTVRPIEAEMDLARAAALAFTSINGVRAFAARSEVRGLPVFAVGDATARAARLVGFEMVASADGDLGDLARLIVRAQPRGLVLYPGGREKAGDLVGDLKAHGVQAQNVALYDTPAVEALPDAVVGALQAQGLAAVLLHSPRAASILAGLAVPFDLSKMVAFGFSDACLRPLQSLGLARTVPAQHPNEDALMDALIATLGNPPRPR